MAYHKSIGQWEHYYETWMHLVNTYTFMGKVNTALHEVKLMHDDATQRHNNYGLALSNYAMGNAYNNMGYLPEAVKCYQLSIQFIRQTNTSETTYNDIYSYYCDALNENHQWKEMKEVTDDWRKLLESMTEYDKGKKTSSSKVWYSYYYLACAQMHLGLNQFDQAEKDIDMAEVTAPDSTDFIQMSILYYRAQLCLQRKDYRKALDYNTRRLEKSLGYEDKSSLVMIREQRAKILNGLGRFEEMAEMYKEVYELTDSMYRKDARIQINELNTLFRVNEFEMEKRLNRVRTTAIVTVVIALTLLLLLGYWYLMNRRLKRKNEELAIARDKAQESSRMKTEFIKNISHEIRTPLNILSGFSQVMAQPDVELPKEIRYEASEKIVENTNRITSLINKLLALSETSSRNRIDRTDTVGINQLCHSAITMSRVGDNLFYHFNFTSDFNDDEQILTAESYAIQAISQLLDNAMKFTPEGGKIQMTCTKTDGLVMISVEDNGCGVPAEKAEDIFKEFVQLDEYQTGTGIGLTLSRNIARGLGGDLILDLSYSQGARFILTLPN
jgi:signal transduction histidine kinase